MSIRLRRVIVGVLVTLAVVAADQRDDPPAAQPLELEHHRRCVEDEVGPACIHIERLLTHEEGPR